MESQECEEGEVNSQIEESQSTPVIKKNKKLDPKKKIHKTKKKEKQFISSTFRTKKCDFYLKGACIKGEKCEFSHDFPVEKKKICKFFLAGACSKGNSCFFSHILSEYPCRFYHLEKKCQFGNDCRFSHQPILQNELQSYLEENRDFLLQLFRYNRLQDQYLLRYVWKYLNDNPSLFQQLNIPQPIVNPMNLGSNSHMNPIMISHFNIPHQGNHIGQVPIVNAGMVGARNQQYNPNINQAINQINQMPINYQAIGYTNQSTHQPYLHHPQGAQNYQNLRNPNIATAYNNPNFRNFNPGVPPQIQNLSYTSPQMNTYGNNHSHNNHNYNSHLNQSQTAKHSQYSTKNTKELFNDTKRESAKYPSSKHSKEQHSRYRDRISSPTKQKFVQKTKSGQKQQTEKSSLQELAPQGQIPNVQIQPLNPDSLVEETREVEKIHIPSQTQNTNNVKSLFNFVPCQKSLNNILKPIIPKEDKLVSHLRRFLVSQY